MHYGCSNAPRLAAGSSSAWALKAGGAALQYNFIAGETYTQQTVLRPVREHIAATFLALAQEARWVEDTARDACLYAA